MAGIFKTAGVPANDIIITYLTQFPLPSESFYMTCAEKEAKEANTK